MASRSWVVIVIVGVAVVSQFQSCDDGIEEVRQQELPASYAERAADNSWPRLTETIAGGLDNLTANNYYIVLDGSGSMEGAECSNGQPKLGVAKQAVTTFVGRLSDSANVGLFSFDDQGMRERVPLGPADVERVRGPVNGLRAGGGTPLSTAIQEGYKALSNQATRQLGYGEYHLVVVTDGEASSGYSPDGDVATLLADSPIVLHTIGFCIDEAHSLNQPGYTLYKAANDPQSLMAGLEAVLAEAPSFQLSDFGGDR